MRADEHVGILDYRHSREHYYLRLLAKGRRRGGRWSIMGRHDAARKEASGAGQSIACSEHRLSMRRFCRLALREHA